MLFIRYDEKFYDDLAEWEKEYPEATHAITENVNGNHRIVQIDTLENAMVVVGVLSDKDAQQRIRKTYYTIPLSEIPKRKGRVIRRRLSR